MAKRDNTLKPQTPSQPQRLQSKKPEKMSTSDLIDELD